MIKRTLTIASLATTLGLGLAAASPADATGPLGGIIANGTQLNGIALEGVKFESLRVQQTVLDDEFDAGCQEEFCPKNGTQLNGIALESMTLESMTLESIELKATEVVFNR